MAKRKRDSEDAPEGTSSQTIVGNQCDEQVATKRTKNLDVNNDPSLNGHHKTGGRISSITATPTLLGIPGELRNRIYEYALVQEYDDEIRIIKHSHQLPSLLRASRQLRDEATAIYIEENIFTLRIRNLRFRPQREHWIWNKIGHERLFQEHCGDRSWKNFKDWLKQFWHDGPDHFPIMPKIEVANEDERVFDRAFDIVEALSDLRWERVEEVLEAFGSAINDKIDYWNFD